jgi:hypothetical protein
MPRGGARTGAGRKKKNRSEQDYFDDAESYLLAVVQGRTLPDAARIAAAKTLIQYERARQRAPVKSPSPGQLHRKAVTSIERAKIAEFERKATIIRAKMQAKGGKK